MRRVVVTGFGIVSSIGNNNDEVLFINQINDSQIYYDLKNLKNIFGFLSKRFLVIFYFR